MHAIPHFALTVPGLVSVSRVARHLRLQDAAQRSLNDAPSGQTVRWSDPRTRESGYFRPVKTHRMADGRLCRDFERGLTVGGEEVDRTTGTACKQSDGQWDTV